MRMRAGRRGRGRLKKTEKALPMQLGEVNTCMFNCLEEDGLFVDLQLQL